MNNISTGVCNSPLCSDHLLWIIEGFYLYQNRTFIALQIGCKTSITDIGLLIINALAKEKLSLGHCDIRIVVRLP